MYANCSEVSPIADSSVMRQRENSIESKKEVILTTLFSFLNHTKNMIGEIRIREKYSAVELMGSERRSEIKIINTRSGSVVRPNKKEMSNFVFI